jgi:hypothetical protein
MRDLLTKKEVLPELHSQLTFTDQEKRVLLSNDDDDFEHARVRREKQLLNMYTVGGDQEDEDSAMFDRFKTDFF